MQQNDSKKLVNHHQFTHTKIFVPLDFSKCLLFGEIQTNDFYKNWVRFIYNSECGRFNAICLRTLFVYQFLETSGLTTHASRTIPHIVQIFEARHIWVFGTVTSEIQLLMIYSAILFPYSGMWTKTVEYILTFSKDADTDHYLCLYCCKYT